MCKARLLTQVTGGTIGVAISGAIFTSKIETVLPNYITTVAVEGGLPTASIPGFVDAIAEGELDVAKSIP